MPEPARIWRVVVTVLLIVLVLATTMGMVWHHHARYSTDQCTLCHLVIAPGAATPGACGLVSAAQEYTVPSDSFVSRCVADQKPPRAPPV